MHYIRIVQQQAVNEGSLVCSETFEGSSTADARTRVLLSRHALVVEPVDDPSAEGAQRRLLVHLAQADGALHCTHGSPHINFCRVRRCAKCSAHAS